MKIGIDVSRANHLQKTGVESYAFFLIQALKVHLQSQSKEVQVVLYTDQPLQGDLADLPNSWTVKLLRWPPGHLWTQIRLSFEMLISPPDVLFVPAHTVPLIHPRKTVMTVHDIAAYRFPLSYSWFERWYSLWSARLAVQRLWRVIVPSLFTKKELQEAFGGTSSLHFEERVCVVPHGFDSAFSFAPKNEEDQKVLQKYQLRSPFVLFIGRLEEKKNTARLVQAFALLKQEYNFPDLQLVLVGKPGFGFESVTQALAKSPVQSDIRQLGYVDSTEAQSLMRQTKVFVFPSLYEGFGLPILEALSAGTPVVAANAGSLPEVGGENILLVQPDDVHDIARGLYQALTDTDWRKQVSISGQKWAQHFSWQKCAEDTAKVLLSKN